MLLRATALVPIVLLAFNGQMKGQASPTQVLDSAFAAVTRRDWAALTAMVHPDVLDSLRHESLGLIILVTEDLKVGKTGGGYNPPEVVIRDHLPRVGNERVSTFPNGPTIAELAALSSGQFFVQWCGAAYRPSSEQDPVMEVVGLKRRIIGEFLQGDSLAYVLYRRESRHIEMNELFIDLPGRVMIMPLKKVNDQWRLMLNDDLGWSVNLMEVLPPRQPIAFHTLKQTTRVAREAPPPSAAYGASARADAMMAASAAFEAFEHRNWEALSSLVDEERLASFQHQQISYLIAWSGSREARSRAKGEGIQVFMMSYDDSLPPEAIARAATLVIPFKPRPRSIGELAALSPRAFFSIWCEAAYARTGRGPGRIRVEQRRRALGTVIESPAIAHVLYRADARDQNPRFVRRMPVRWSGQRWLIDLNDDIGWEGDLEWELEGP